MNGPVEEGGKVASGVIEALKTQPIVLALVVFQCVFLALSYIGIEHARQNNLALVERMVGQQDRFMDMLYNCTPNRKEP